MYLYIMLLPMTDFIPKTSSQYENQAIRFTPSFAVSILQIADKKNYESFAYYQ